MSQGSSLAIAIPQTVVHVELTFRFLGKVIIFSKTRLMVFAWSEICHCAVCDMWVTTGRSECYGVGNVSE